MEWEGEYKIKCPKCGCRRILVEEHSDAFHQHIVDNGVWLENTNNNDYGDYTYTIFVCNDCGHSWKKIATSDYYTDEAKEERKKKREEKRIQQMKASAEFWKLMKEELDV